MSLIPQSQLFNDILPAAVIIAVDGRVEEANQAALNLLEAQDLSELTGRELSDFVHPLDQPRSQARARREGESFVNPAAKFRIRTVKGAYRMVLLSSRAFQHEGRDALMVSGLDMTDHEALDAQMRESEHNFRRLFTNMQDVYYRTDVRGMLVQVSPSVEAMLGYSAEELKGEDVRRFYTEDTDSEAYVQRILQHGRVTDFPARMRSKFGRIVDISLNSQAILDDEGKFAGIEGIFRDVSQRLEMEQELKRLATTDALTNIENRRAFLEHADHVFRSAQRYGTVVSMLMLDLDLFKTVNDEHGHIVGDQVLVRFAEQVKRELREIDLFGRLGGEEFCVLLQHTNAEQAGIVAERIRKRIAQLRFFDDDGANFSVTVSIGISANQQEDRQLERLMERADRALYLAKHEGRDQTRCI